MIAIPKIFAKFESLNEAHTMMQKFFMAILAGGLLSCSAQKPAAQQKDPEKAAVSGCVQTGKLPLDWILLQNKSLEETGDGRKLPLKYDVYEVNNQQAATFFKDIQENKGGRVTLPLPSGLGCHSYKVSPSGTLNAALADKYPRLVSLKGADEQEKGNIVRLDYDGEKINAQITWNYKVYVIQPWNEKGSLYYLVSKAEDTGYERVPYEKPGTGGYKK